MSLVPIFWDDTNSRFVRPGYDANSGCQEVWIADYIFSQLQCQTYDGVFANLVVEFFRQRFPALLFADKLNSADDPAPFSPDALRIAFESLKEKHAELQESLVAAQSRISILENKCAILDTDAVGKEAEISKKLAASEMLFNQRLSVLEAEITIVKKMKEAMTSAVEQLTDKKKEITSQAFEQMLDKITSIAGEK